MRRLLLSAWLARVCGLLALLLCALVLMRSGSRTDFAPLLSPQPAPEQRLLMQPLQDGAARVLLLGIEGAPSRTLAALGKQTAAVLRAEPLLRQVQNGEAAAHAADQALLYPVRYLLSPQVLPERFSAAGLHQALQEGLAEPGARELLARDPTGEMNDLLDHLLPAGGPRLRHGHWFNARGDRALLQLETRADDARVDAQEQVIARVRQAYAQAQQALAAQDPKALDARLLVGGPGVLALAARDALRGEAARLALSAVLLGVGLLTAAVLARRARPALPPGPRLRRAMQLLRHGRHLLLLLALAAAVLLVQRPGGWWSLEPADPSPAPQSVRQLDAELRAELAVPDARHLIVVRAPEAQTALQRCEALLPELDRMVLRGQLGGYVAPCRYLPSLATQRVRQQTLPDAPTLRRELGTALKGLPLGADFLTPFLEDVEAARAQALLRPADMQAASFSTALDATLIPSTDHASALIQLRAPLDGPRAHTIDPFRVRAALAPLLDEHTVLLDLQAASDERDAQYLRQTLLLSVLGLASIVLALALQLRDARRVAAALLPLAVVALLVAAGLELAGIRPQPPHLAGLLLTVAVGAGYARYFNAADGSGHPRTLALLLLANLATAAGLGLLACSRLPVPQAWGLTAGPGVMLTLLFAAVLSRPPNHG